MDNKKTHAALATLLFLSAGLTSVESHAALVTVDAAIRGNADGFFIDTGNSLSAVPTAAEPEVSVSDNVSANGYTFEYLATSNVQSGALKMRTSASSDPGSSGQATASGLGMPQAIAQMQEGLTFTPSNADPFSVTLSMAVDGLFVQDTGSVSADASLYYWVNGGVSGSVFRELFPTGSVNELLVVTLTNLQGVTTMGFQAGIEAFIFGVAGGGHAISADFANTAQLALAVPAGVTVTSDSGLFLTAVPLPAALPLLASALLGLGLLGRRRRQA